jgi:hypothetical protein
MVHVLLGACPAQGLLDHHPGAVADAGANRLARHGLMPAAREHVVQRVG